jgi:hypothetical protein
MKDTSQLVKVHVDLPHHWMFKGESLWARPLGDDLYAIENVPFGAYGLNCGDVVRAEIDAPGQKPEVREVVERSGNRTLRVAFGKALDVERQQPHIEAIQALGAWIERMNVHFIAINVPPEHSYDAVRALLSDRQKSEVLDYETCEARAPGSFDDVRPK